MARGRGSANNTWVMSALVAAICLFAYCEVILAATYTVGDSQGWAPNVASWPKGKKFKAGDVLVFKYSSGAHNVVTVNSGGYKGCTTPRGSKVFQTGNDQITLNKGLNFFICNFPGHCEAGMKIAIQAA